MTEFRTFNDLIAEELKNDPEACDLYLESAIEEYNENLNKKALISALRHISEAKGISKIAKKSGLSRETFYKSLSPNGNPRIETLFSIMKAFNYIPSIVARKMPA
ncbi:hypothetical protein FACS1894122_13590 [Alphaproteobacteria bacterium]|nr:hypothetical protein FACS1894122_13590 [Alphaproteobacteria bacterium]